MSDVAPGLSPAEAKFFETRGEVAPETPAAEPVVEQPAEPAPEVVEKPEAKVEEPKGEEDEKSTWSPERLRNEFDQRRAALKETRSELKRERAERAKEREELARLKGMLEATQPKAPEAKSQIPAVDTDPISHFDQRIRKIEETEAQKAQREAQQSQMTELVGVYRQKATEFAAETPDFGEAQGHFVTTLKRELVMLGKTPQDAEQQAIQIEAMAVLSALQAGENPAARVYELAKIRGYQKAAPKEQPKPETDKLANIEQGQKASKSLDSAGTAKPSLSIKAFLDMDNDEQAALLTNPKEFRRLAGG